MKKIVVLIILCIVVAWVFAYDGLAGDEKGIKSLWERIYQLEKRVNELEKETQTNKNQILEIKNELDGAGENITESNAPPIIMQCVNPDCKAAVELSRDEYRDMMLEEINNSESGPMGMMMPGMGPMVMTCPECEKKSLYMAKKCEKCNTVFIEDYTKANDWPDRCPKCNFSKMETLRKRK